MKITGFYRWPICFAGAVLVAIAAEFSGLAKVLNGGEDSVLEVSQLLLLPVLAGLFVWTFAGSNAGPGTRALCLGALGVVLAAIGREVNWGRIYGLSPQVVLMFKVANAGVSGALVAAAIHTFAVRVADRRAFLYGFFRSGFCSWIAFALSMLAAADIVEQWLHGLANSEFHEEFFELLAYLSVLRAALTLRGAEWWRPVTPLVMPADASSHRKPQPEDPHRSPW